jgi:hypothetical protein
MEQAGKVFDIGITLICLAMVVSVLFFGVWQSKSIASDGFEVILDKTNVKIPIENAKWKDREIPTAAVSSILRAYGNSISEFRCDVSGKTSTGDDIGDCLFEHLDGTGYLTLTEDGADGYIAHWRSS